jgi:hypothetical protein
MAPPWHRFKFSPTVRPLIGSFHVFAKNAMAYILNLAAYIRIRSLGFGRLDLTTGCSITATGPLVVSPAGFLELHPTSIEKIGACDAVRFIPLYLINCLPILLTMCFFFTCLFNQATYPMSKKKHSLEHLRDVAHLRSRGNTIGAVMRVRNSAMMAVHNFFQVRFSYFFFTAELYGLSRVSGH